MVRPKMRDEKLISRNYMHYVAIMGIYWEYRLGIYGIYWGYMGIHRYKVGPPFAIAKLANITPITVVLDTDTYNYSIHAVYKPCCNGGGTHCSNHPKR